MNFRLNQRLCRVEWDNGIPSLEFGTVTKVTSTTYYVNGSKNQGAGWTDSAKEAFIDGFTQLFRYHDLLFGLSSNKPRDNWDAINTANCVCKLMRLKRRFDHIMNTKKQIKETDDPLPQKTSCS